MSAPQLLLPRNLAALAKCCAKGDQLRYGATTGVQLAAHATDAEGNDYCATVTDGRQLVTVAGPMPFACADYPMFSALESAPNSGTCNVVSARDWVSAFKMVPKRTYKPILETLPVVLGADVTTFGATDLESCQSQTPINLTRLQQIDGGKPGAMAPVARFPDWRRSLPTEQPRYTIAVDPRIMSQVCDTLSALASDEGQRVDLDLFAPDKPMRLTAKNHDNGQTITALIVPLVSSDTGKAPNPMTGEKTYDGAVLDEMLARMRKEYDDDREAFRARIGELETERDGLQDDLDNADKSDAQKQIAQLTRDLDDAQKENVEWQTVVSDAGYDDLETILADLASAQAQNAELHTLVDTEGHRLTVAWSRIEDLERVNALLRANFDTLARGLKR